MSLLTDRDEFNVGSAFLGLAAAVLATATATGWGVPVSATLILLLALRGWWRSMPNWLLLLWAGVPVIVTEATDECLVVGLDGPTRGCTIPDRRHLRPDPNIRVVWSVDEAAFKRRLLAACAD